MALGWERVVSMARVVKKPDVRKAEILAVAQRLFFSVGYENTSVNSIIQEAGISKGAFYHYFTTKDDLVAALTEQFREQLIVRLTEILEMPISALEKLNLLFQRTQTEKFKNLDKLKMYFQVLYEDNNIKLTTKVKQNNFETALPLVEQIIQQGVDNREFKVASPRSAAEFVLVLGMYMGEQLALILAENSSRGTKSPELEFERYVSSFESSVETLLGLPTRSFISFDRPTLHRLLRYFERSNVPESREQQDTVSNDLSE